MTMRVLDLATLRGLPPRGESAHLRKQMIADAIRLQHETERELGGAPYATLLLRRSTWRRRRAAAGNIAANMPTKVAHRKAYYALDDEQGELWLREKIFVPALLEAARGLQRPQYIRFGAKWVTDAGGRKARVRPIELEPPHLVKRWLLMRTYAIAAKKLAGGRPLARLTERE